MSAEMAMKSDAHQWNWICNFCSFICLVCVRARQADGECKCISTAFSASLETDSCDEKKVTFILSSQCVSVWCILSHTFTRFSSSPLHLRFLCQAWWVIFFHLLPTPHCHADKTVNRWIVKHTFSPRYFTIHSVNLTQSDHPMLLADREQG